MRNNLVFKRNVLFFCVVAAIWIGVWTRIHNDGDYVFAVLIILSGLNGILDFCLGLPMRRWYSGVIHNDEDKKFSRIMHLIGGIALFAFGVSWFLWQCV